MNRRDFFKVGAAVATLPVMAKLPVVQEKQIDSPISEIYWNGNNFVAITGDGYIFTADDGITWTERAVGV